MNIAPTLEDKVDIVQNAIDLAHALGFPEVRVAILSAMETVNPKVPSTDRGRGAVQDGRPRADHRRAFSTGRSRSTTRSASRRRKIKKIDSPVAGRANVLVVPDLEAGNMLAKSLSFLAGADAAGIVLGARVPIILTSRADSVLTRLASCAVAALVAKARREASNEGGGVTCPMRSLVLNAGSSSLKFSLFAERGDALELTVRGQIEGLHTAPRFVAKDRHGKIVGEKSWGDGVKLGHDGALDHLVDFLRAQLGEHRLDGSRTPRRSRRARVQPSRFASTRRCCRRWSKYVPLAPLHQPHNLAPIRALLETRAGAASGRVLRHRIPPCPARGRTGASHSRGRSPTRGVRRYGFHGLSYEYIAQALSAYDAKAAAGRVVVLHLGNGSSMCAHDGRPQRREHDGLHRGRRPADGHAVRQPRPGRDPLPSGRAQDGRARNREAHLSAVGPARRIGHFQRHARPCSRATMPGAKARDRPLTFTESAASWARSRLRSAGWTRVVFTAGHRREQRGAARAGVPRCSLAGR